jgi:hypothetical protein
VNAEDIRLAEAREKQVPWRRWGPYLSERQWGTVREDYSPDGNAWSYFTHDQARSRAYRWGEDGVGGICDDAQRLCFALAVWNGKDPILKERLFGLTNAEGNHGEDCKEYYYYLDSTPTHSYMKFLYKYPHEPYPYDDLVRTNGQRGRHELEYELIDTGVFAYGYWDVLVEYAKQSPDDLLIQVSVTNRGQRAARLHLLPTLWFRNTWSWANPTPKPQLRRETVGATTVVAAAHREIGAWRLYCDENPPLLFTENETNSQRCFGTPNASPYVKDGINDYVVHGRHEAVNAEQVGTKASADYELDVGPGETRVVRLRLAPASETRDPFGPEFASTFGARRAEADEFYRSITPPSVGDDAASVMRQALAGMLWSKQFYYYDIQGWFKDRSGGATAPAPHGPRNTEWTHMVNADVLSMPDKWEYPWYAAWDLAFHCVPLAAVDPDFAKQQILLMLKEHYLHPSGQLPAYEWNFGDVNPPVHAWAALYVYHIDRQRRGGGGDVAFLKTVFHKLTLNFTWWVNRKDRTGRNVFEGGFLGLDNIGVFDRSAPLPTGGYLEQADGTAWMAFFSQCMLEIAIELTHHDAVYEDYVLKFSQHFLAIASAMDHLGAQADEKMWDEEDGFFYDVLRLPDGRAQRLKVRSMVGLLSLCATTVLTPESVADPAGDRAGPVVPRPQPGVDGQHRQSPRAGRRKPPAPVAAQRGQAPPNPERDARRERVPEPVRHPLAFPGSRRRAVRVQPGRPDVPGRLRAGRIHQRDVWWQLQLARAGMDAGQHPSVSRTPEAVRLLRGWFQGGVSDRLGCSNDSVRGRPGTREPPDRHLHPRHRRTPTRLWQ